MLYSSFSRAIPHARITRERTTHAVSIPDSGAGWLWPTMIPLKRKIRLTFGLLTTVTPSLETPEALRFARPTRHILSYFSTRNAQSSIGRKAIAGCFQRGSFRMTCLENCYIFNKSAAFFGEDCAGTATQTNSTTYRQARMNSRNLSNIATHFPERQPYYRASNLKNHLRLAFCIVAGKMRFLLSSVNHSKSSLVAQKFKI